MIKTHHALLVKRYAGSGPAILDFDLHPLENMLRTCTFGKASVLELHKCIRDSDESAGVSDIWDGRTISPKINRLCNTSTCGIA